MTPKSSRWQINQPASIPGRFLTIVREYVPDSDGHHAAQLLWKRGIRDPNKLVAFLDPDAYQPTSPFAFGQEMKWAVKRLQKAREKGEKVTIWGDFDADGITATSILWEGLGQFFPQHLQLNYTIPNRLTESHGLNCQGIERLVGAGTRLIVTCDTGSTNLQEIEYARELGIDTIVTDHHTLPEERPPVVSIINPRYFIETHPLFHLSGVAVAYKLVEALYCSFPAVPQQPLETLLDLVAIGLIADLVELKGDCRYLAQKGIQQLQKQLTHPTRPGVAKLLQLCKKTGDRPTDISFGLGPRINAVSRIQGDGNFCVELLTSRDKKRCEKLALDTELANTRRKSLQKDIVKQVKKKLSQVDLSTTAVIILEDPQWPSGILGLVAGKIAQEYGRPTILLSTADESQDKGEMAKGSARSVKGIDLYQLVASQSHLLHRFGGHPLAAGLSLPVENIPLFRDAINQQLRQQYSGGMLGLPILQVDLVVTVAELGKSLFRELKLLEPCGMGNPVPKLLIRNCWFEVLKNENQWDLRGKKVQYIKTKFKIYDSSVREGFCGIWWEHYKEDLPEDTKFDAIVELDYNPHSKAYEVRLLDLHLHVSAALDEENLSHKSQLIDWRNNLKDLKSGSAIVLKDCPHDWRELRRKYELAMTNNENLALAYNFPKNLPPEEAWKQLLGIAKYLSRTGITVKKEQLKEKLRFSDILLRIGLKALEKWGFNCLETEAGIKLNYSGQIQDRAIQDVSQFFEAIAEEQFKQQYFCQVPLAILTERLNNLL